MTDFNDLGAMSAEELRQQADALAIEYTTKTTKTELVAAIRKELGEEEVSAPAPAARASTKERLYRVTIMANDDDEEQSIVPVSVNGVIQPFLRGQPIVVKERYVEALRNAVRIKTNRKTGAQSEVPSYPYTAELVEG